MIIIKTHEDRPSNFDAQQREFVYNGLDCCLTSEIFDEIHPQLDEHTSATYEFSKALQGPVLEMRCRGVLVDQHRKNQVIEEFYEHLEKLEDNLQRIVLEGVGLLSFNWRSNPDLHALFYERLRIPTITRNGRPTVDRTALEKFEGYTIARPIVAHISAMREIAKKISVLKTAIDPDGYMRTSYNIAGTNGGRFSSSFSEFGTGGNLQNVEESLRSIFIADPGMKFAKFDAGQIQSRVVGAAEWNILGDGTYLDACESGDLHTIVAKMVWPTLEWTGDLKKDRTIANGIFYRHYSRRDMCKKLGHGSNFAGKPPTLNAETKVPIPLITEFQRSYFTAFPQHHQWFQHTQNELYKKSYLVSLCGRKRHFWGRRNDDETLRQALAFEGQDGESFIVNTAMLNIWRKRTAILIAQEHDALVFMYREEEEDEIIPKLLAQLPIQIPLKHNRVLEVPYDAKTGWNKGDWSEANPYGLKEYSPGDKRKRPAKVHILDRSVR